MAQYSFGSGQIFGLRTDIPTQTPVALGVLQDVQIDFAGDIKELYGCFQFPVAVARGKTKITGKAKYGRLNGEMFNALFFGQTLTQAQTLTSLGEAQTVAAATPFIATATNAARWVADLGVTYAATGLALEVVSGAPTAAGQYSVAAGVYTFDTADSGADVLLNYTYTGPTGAGSLIQIANLPMGTMPTWRATFTTTFNGKSFTLGLNSCVSSKLAFPTKQDDWTISELDFQGLADASGNVGYISLAE